MVIQLWDNSICSTLCRAAYAARQWLYAAAAGEAAVPSGRTDFPAVCAGGPTDRADGPADQAAVNRQAERLLDTYGNSILRLAYSYLHNTSDAEEVVQDTLIQFLRTAPALESPAHEKAWLLRVAANLSKNRIRYNQRRNAEELSEQLPAQEAEDLSFVWEAVAALPEKYRVAIHLFYHEGCSTDQIARILGESPVAVRSHLHRGRQQLKKILKEAYDFDEKV